MNKGIIIYRCEDYTTRSVYLVLNSGLFFIPAYKNRTKNDSIQLKKTKKDFFIAIYQYIILHSGQ